MARLKGLAGLPAYITDEPQDGVIPGLALGCLSQVGDVRLACLPTVRGQRLA